MNWKPSCQVCHGRGYNVHDDGLIFEPIHRILFDVSFNVIIEAMKHTLAGILLLT